MNQGAFTKKTGVPHTVISTKENVWPNTTRDENLMLFDLVKELRDSCDALRKAIEKIK